MMGSDTTEQTQRLATALKLTGRHHGRAALACRGTAMMISATFGIEIRMAHFSTITRKRPDHPEMLKLSLSVLGAWVGMPVTQKDTPKSWQCWFSPSEDLFWNTTSHLTNLFSSLLSNRRVSRQHWPCRRSRPGICPACSIPFNLSTSANDEAFAMAFWKQKKKDEPSLHKKCISIEKCIIFLCIVFFITHTIAYFPLLAHGINPWSPPQPVILQECNLGLTEALGMAKLLMVFIYRGSVSYDQLNFTMQLS